MRELDVDEFTGVLRELDGAIDGQRIEIRAVGGFALAWRHVRESGLTADIDTLTDDYPENVQATIEEIGKKRGLGPWWLNNDAAAGDARFVDEVMDLKWEKVDAGLANIDLYVADLESLLNLKIAALEDSVLSGRARDLEDAVKIALALGYDKEGFRRRFAYLQEDQPNAYRMMMRAIW